MPNNNAHVHDALASMFATAIERQMPKAYHSDLGIDVFRLAYTPHDKPFIWILRENGTHLDTLGLALHDWTGKNALFAYEKRLFYVWTGSQLVLTDGPEDANRVYRNAILASNRTASDAMYRNTENTDSDGRMR